MNVRSVALILLAVLGCVPPSESPSEPPKNYEPLLETAIDHGFPAFVLWVQRPDGEIWSGAVGYSNLEQQREASTEDVYHFASITKIFTAVATLRLVDEGKVRLDDRVADLLARPSMPPRAWLTLSMTWAGLLAPSMQESC